MSLTASGRLSSSPDLSYGVIKYPKGSFFVWLCDASGSIDALTAALSETAVAALISDDSQSGNSLGRRLCKAVGKPVYLASSSGVATHPNIEAELVTILAGL